MASIVIGKHGFIGSHLAKRIRDVSEYPVEGAKVLYDFGSPTHQYWNDYCTTQAIERIVQLAPWCRENDVLYVFPSSALIYEKQTRFTRAKLACEQLLMAYGVRHLIIRFWPIYGDTEVSKGENSSVIDIWRRDMRKGIRPVVYGDGNQERGFIHVDKAIDKMLALVERGDTGRRDIAGKPISFNEIIANLNDEFGTKIKPTYVTAPKDYSLKSPKP